MNRSRQGTDHDRPRVRGWGGIVAACGLALVVLGGCQPTVRVEAPDKPIVINLNVKIEQDVRVRLEKDVEQVLNGNPDIF